MAGSSDPESAVPAYRRLAAMLREEIARGRIEPDRPLPSEERLVREHGFALADVRRAVEVLSGEGLVYTIEGRGTYVSTRAEETGGG